MSQGYREERVHLGKFTPLPDPQVFVGVKVRKFGMSSNKWEGPITLTLDRKKINWVYDSGTNMQWDEDKGEILMWTYGDGCRNMDFFSGMKTLKKNRIDITLKVPNQTPDERGLSEIGKPYAFEFQNENDYDRASRYLKQNIGESTNHLAACNRESINYGKDGFEKFKKHIFSGGKRKRKTKRKMTKRKKMQKKRKTNKRKKSIKRR